MIDPSRIRVLADRATRGGRFVLYWMQASQREACNHALECAARHANRLNLPLVVCFGLTDAYPEANERHYAFMLDGLRETQADLAARGVRLIIRRGSPEQVALELSADAALLVADRGYLLHQKQWRRRAAQAAPCPVVEVETDVVVPVDVASNKAEYAAATLRPKVHRHLDKYLRLVRRTPLRRDSLGLGLGGLELGDTAAMLATMEIDRTVRPVDAFRGGTSQAVKLLRRFIRDKLKDYAARRNDPSLGIQSHMSPYLHFGQISPIQIALAVHRARGAGRNSKQAYLEELIVRRELSVNFVERTGRYDTFECLPAWSRQALRHHAKDHREHLYSLQQLERAETHDPYWNAAMREMLLTGKMHNYMRMYWGKKILAWSRTPQQAFRTALYLNNKYFLDGRDPNSYAGVAWCFGKHDRPWRRRAVFGTVRYMSAGGLERKFDMEAYVRQVEAIGSRGQKAPQCAADTDRA